MNIENIKKLLSSIPMLEETLQNCNFIIDNEITGVVTDGKDVYYNPKFMENKSSEQQAFAFANALCHIKFDHIKMSLDKEKVLWNIATDAVINEQLMNEGLERVEECIFIPGASNYTEEELYEYLLEQKNKMQVSEPWDGKMYAKFMSEISLDGLNSKKTK